MLEGTMREQDAVSLFRDHGGQKTPVITLGSAQQQINRHVSAAGQRFGRTGGVSEITTLYEEIAGPAQEMVQQVMIFVFECATFRGR